MRTLLRNPTRLIILATVFVWIGWDIYTYWVSGNPSTESAWLVRQAWYHPWMPFVVGMVVGHIFFDLREPIDWPKNLSETNKP